MAHPKKITRKIAPLPLPPLPAPAPVVVAPPPPPVMVDFPGKGEIRLEDARKFAGTYGQFLKKLSPEICPDGVTTPTCRADIAATAAVLHIKEYAADGREDSRTLAISSIDTLYSLSPTDESFLLMIMLRQHLGIDLARLQRKVSYKKSDTAISWGPLTFLTNDTLSMNGVMRKLEQTNAKLSQTTWTLEKTVAQKLLTDHKEAIHEAILRAHAGDPLGRYLQSARMEVLLGNRDDALVFLDKAQAILTLHPNTTNTEKRAQIAIWHRQATLMAPSTDRQKLLRGAAKILEMLPKGSAERISLGIENLALTAQFEEQELRASLKGDRDETAIHMIRNIYDTAVVAAEKLFNEASATGHRYIQSAPLLELKATLAEQQLGIAFSWHMVEGFPTRAAKIRKSVEEQLKKDVASFDMFISPQDASMFKARHYWAMAQYDFFTGAIQNAVTHLQTIATLHRGTPHETMLWSKDNWPFMAGIVSGERTFSPELNEASVAAGMKTFMKAYLDRRGVAFVSCEAGALLFTLGTAIATKRFSAAAPLAGCFAGNAGIAMDTWSDASDLIRQSYVTGLSAVTDIQSQEMINSFLMQTTIAAFSGLMGYVAQRYAIAFAAPLQRNLLSRRLIVDTPWMYHSVTIGFRETSHVAGGLAMGTVSNAIYGVLGENEHQSSHVDNWLTYSVLGWIGVVNPGVHIFGKTGFVAGAARAFTNISISGWSLGVYQTLQHPSDVPFLKQSADATLMMGVLHSTLSFARMWRSSTAIPQPLDDVAVQEINIDSAPPKFSLAVGERPLTSLGRGTLGRDGFYHPDTMDPAVYRRGRRESDRLMNVNTVVRTHMENFLKYVQDLTSKGPHTNMENTVYHAKSELAELVALSKRGLVVDIRELGITWSTPELAGIDTRIMTLQILDSQVQKGNIKRPSQGLLRYPTDNHDFTLLSIFQVLQPSWSVTRTNITAINEAYNANPKNPILEYVALRIFNEVGALPPKYASIRQHCTDTLRQSFSRHGIDPESGDAVTPVPDFIMSTEKSLTSTSEAVSSEVTPPN